MGRKKDLFWDYVEKLNDKVIKCKFCGDEFAGGASRIKGHLSGIKRKGIHACTRVPEEIQLAASTIFDDSNKRTCSSVSLSDHEQNFVNSDLPNDPSTGNTQGYPLPTGTDLIGEQFQRYIEKIWRWLMEDQVSVIGVWGMGGVGKTTLLKHIHNKLLEGVNGFDHIVWVTVSQHFSILQLQTAIAESFDLDISDQYDEMKIAAKLLHEFSRKRKCAIILDNVWDDILLENMGIPLSNNGIKLILTSRLFHVCQRMGCKKHILKVEPLKNGEDWDLFLKNLGENRTLPSEVMEIAKSINGECEGLPLAIVTIARSMRGMEDIREVKHLLEKLKNLENGQEDIEKGVFPVLRLSFDQLNDNTLREAFLYFALFPRYESFKREELIIHLVDEGLIHGKESLEAQFDNGHIILNKLINNSLLKEEKHLEESFVDLHRLIWAMAVSIAKESHEYMIKGKNSLTEIPLEDDWNEDLHKVSFIWNTIKEIPLGTSPRCPKLSTLLLNDSYYLQVIHDNFFMNMASLKVLNLSNSGTIKNLPMSVSHLESLTSLLLAHCRSLVYVPSLAKLQKLQKLDLSYTAIAEIPSGLETLINLRWLNLEGTKQLKMSPASIIPRLINLQSLFLNLCSKSMDVKAEHLDGLKNLEIVSANLSDRDEFNAYVKAIQARSHVVRSYFLQLLETDGYQYVFHEVDYTCKVVRFAEMESSLVTTLLLPLDLNALIVYDCGGWKSLCDVLTFHKNNDHSPSRSSEISHFNITGCYELEFVFCYSRSCSFCTFIYSLNELNLCGLDSLHLLCKETEVATDFFPSWGPFSYLKALNITRCNGIKKLMTVGMITLLQNLEKICVESCKSLEEMFSSTSRNGIDIDMIPHCEPFDEIFSLARYNEDEEAVMVNTDHCDSAIIALPKLKSVMLKDLPELHSVCKGILACTSPKKFIIFGCPNLTVLPQSQPPFEMICPLEWDYTLDEEFYSS